MRFSTFAAAAAMVGSAFAGPVKRADPTQDLSKATSLIEGLVANINAKLNVSVNANADVVAQLGPILTGVVAEVQSVTTQIGPLLGVVSKIAPRQLDDVPGLYALETVVEKTTILVATLLQILTQTLSPIEKPILAILAPILTNLFTAIQPLVKIVVTTTLDAVAGAESEAQDLISKVDILKETFDKLMNPVAGIVGLVSGVTGGGLGLLAPLGVL